MDNKFSLNEVDNFIKKFKNKNKMNKNNTQISQNEVKGEQQQQFEALPLSQTYSFSNTEVGETKVIATTKEDEAHSIFNTDKQVEANYEDNNTAEILFNSKHNTSKTQGLNQSRTIQSPLAKEIKPVNKPIKDIKNESLIKEINESNPGQLPNNTNTDYSTSRSINQINQFSSSNANSSTNELTKSVPVPVSNASLKVIVLDKNPFEDEPDTDPSAFFETQEKDIPVQPTSSIKSNKKIKLNVPKPVVTRNENVSQLKPISQVSNTQIDKPPIKMNDNDNTTNQTKEKLSSNKEGDSININEVTNSNQNQSNSIQFPQFKDKKYQKPVQYAKPPMFNQPKPNTITNTNTTNSNITIPPYQRPQIPSYIPNNTNDYNNNNNDNKSSFKNIYTNFSTELQAKTEIFQSDTINKAIERLDDDMTDQKENPRFRTNSLDYHNQRGEIANEDPNILQLDNDHNRPMDSPSNTNTEQVVTATSLSNGCLTLVSQSHISIRPITTLLNELERDLYMNYFPISYSEQFNFPKIISYLETLQSINSTNNNLTSSIAIYLELLLLKKKMNLSACNLFNESNSSIRNEIIQMIKSSITNIKNTNDYNTIKQFFDFKITMLHDADKALTAPYNIKDPSVTIDTIKENCFSEYSINSLALLSIISNQDCINEYLLSLFNKGIMNKHSYWYLLLILKSGQIDKLLQEDSSSLFDYFPYFVLVLLENYTSIPNVNQIISSILKSNDSKLTYLHYIILFFLQNSFAIDNEALHGQLITSFLNLPNIQKIILCDVFNYFCFGLNDNLPQVIAKSSILIKFKYTLIKLYDNDSSVIELGKKINENYIQFGLIGKNKYFKDYLTNSYVNNISKETYSSISNSSIANSKINAKPNTNNKSYNNDNSSGNSNAIQYQDNTNNNYNNSNNTNCKKYTDNTIVLNQPPIDDYHGQTYINEDVIVKETTTTIMDNNNSNDNKNSGEATPTSPNPKSTAGGTNTSTRTDIFGGGIVSSIFSTFGLGLTSTNKKAQDTNNNKSNRAYSQEELNQMPHEVRWKIEHPNEEEIYYDKEKKRYVLRGKIYDDQEEVIQKKEKEKPFVAPPKYKKPVESQNEAELNGNESQGDSIQQQNQSKPQFKAETSSISNPFISSKPPPQIKANQQNQKQKGLTNRYAVGYKQ